MAKKTRTSGKGGEEAQELVRNEEQEQELALLANSTDPHIIEIQRKITSVFDLFDQSNKRAIDVREVGSIVRALDLYPTEAEVEEIIRNVEESSGKGIVKLERFVPYVTKIILDDNLYKPIPYDRLRRAFKLIDKDRKGILDPAKIRDLFMREGEPFVQEEIDEMLNFCVNKQTGKIHWQEYLPKLCKYEAVAETTE